MSKPIETSVPSDLHPYMNEIAERLFSGHAAVMVGSGFSRNAKPHGHPDPNFPDWSQLGDLFYEKLYDKRPDANNRYLSVPTLAHEVEAAIGRPALDQILREAIPDQDSEPSALHMKLLDLPWSDVFTTNYDTLLERARKSITSRKYDVVVTQDDLVYSEKPRIIKLHGSFAPFRSFVVTDEDYRRYPYDFAPFVNTVRQAFLENTLCLIGFSGNDPNFLQWIGWIHDNLGRQNSPRMYLIGMLQLSDSQMRLLEQRNIVTLDLSGYRDIETDEHYEALERFFEYLHSRKSEYSGWDWPTDPLDNKQPIADLVIAWRNQRRSFPGWIIVPEDQRRDLWSTLESWIRTPPAPNSLSQFLDLEFAFELIWRMEKCLCPIEDRQIDFIEKTLLRYQQFVDPDTPPATLSAIQEDLAARQITRSDVRYMCHHLLLAVMRHYREEGLKEQWHRVCSQISRCMATMTPEHKAHFYYERTLAALFNLNLPAIKKSLQEWPIDESLPFWEAKRAGLLAEIGQVNAAKRILENALEAIRSKSDLKPITTDYSAGSQESIVMFLLQATQQISEYQKSIKEFNERWHILRQYKCDPRNDLQKFALALEQPPTNRSDTPVTDMPTFDIGRRARRFHFQTQNKELLMAYNFLRFCEDAGIPFRMYGTLIATTSAGGALSRIAAYSPHWAMVSLVRIGDKKDVDRIFARASLARMDVDTVDNLVARYLEALDLAVTDIVGSGNRTWNANFGTLLAGVVPEILSRLCCKCSTDAQERLIEFLFQVYQSDAKANYSGIQKLTARLLEACPMHQRYDLIPKLLDFPILSNLEGIEQNEYQNPFRLLEFTRDWIFAQPMLSTDNKLDLLLKNASSHNVNTRKWALITLGKLHQWKFLNVEYTDQFARVLWDQLDDEGLPSNTDFHRFVFLELPHPKEFDPVELFKKYVRDAQFPGLKDFSPIGFPQEWTIWDEIQAAYPFEWSDDDMHYIVKRLVEWWDINQKQYKIQTEGVDLVGMVVEAQEEIFSNWAKTLAAVISNFNPPHKGHPIRDTLSRVIRELSTYELPVLYLESTCLHMFPERRDSILRRIEEGMMSSKEETVIEALDAVWIMSNRIGAEPREEVREDLICLLETASQILRSRRDIGLPQAIGRITSEISRHPWVFTKGIEQYVLEGLRHLISDTAIRTSGNPYLDVGRDDSDVSTKLTVRLTAARLAYALSKYYAQKGKPMPEVITEWENICLSNNEFAEIRNQWIVPNSE